MECARVGADCSSGIGANSYQKMHGTLWRTQIHVYIFHEISCKYRQASSTNYNSTTRTTTQHLSTPACIGLMTCCYDCFIAHN